MATLPSGPFSCIVADPPWAFDDRGTRLAPGYAGKQRKAAVHYNVLTLRDICALPVQEIAADDCFLFLWIPEALRTSTCYFVDQHDADTGERFYTQRKSEAKHAQQAFELAGFHTAVLEAWGFTPTGAEIVWVKGHVEPDGLVVQIGGGHTVRNAHETCLIARRGKPARLSAGVASVVLAPRTAHSSKPGAFYAAVEKLCGGPYIDLFGETKRHRRDVMRDATPPSVGGQRKVKYIFRAVSALTGQVHFEGSQPDLNRFLARVRSGAAHLPVVAEELRVEKAIKPRRRPLRQDSAPDQEPGTIYAEGFEPRYD